MNDFKTIPRGPFGARATAEHVTAGVDLTGKTALVTGATSGIGRETVRVLALRGAHVIALARTQKKADDLAASLGPLAPRIIPMVCEHEDLKSVLTCAAAVRALNRPLHLVVANAGIFGNTRLEQINGVEKHFAVNHLSHFVLLNNLMDPIIAGKGRVVMVSSNAHRYALGRGILFDDISGARGYAPMKFYANSKMANHLFTRALARRLAPHGVTVNSIHPGVVLTSIFKNLPALLRVPLMLYGRMFMKTVEAGASTMCYVATAPGLAGVSGAYFADCNPVDVRGFMVDDAMAEKLWTVSEDLTQAYRS